MRIAILGQYPLDTERLGGVEVAIVYAQQELLKIPDVELHIVSSKEQLTAPRVVKQERLTITYLPRKRWGRMTGHRQDVQAMNQLLREIKPDIVHAHGSGLYAGAALASPYPTVITVHGIASEEARLLTGWRNKLRGMLDTHYECSVIKETPHLILITPYVATVFQDKFRGKSYLIENACDERFFALERRPVPGRLFFAGPVLSRKGVLPLLKALFLVRQHLPAAHLHIAGTTTVRPLYFRACQDYVRQAGLGDAVTFLGHLAQDQVLEEYSTCAAFVLPSFQETAPMVIEQAMAAGVVSVATAAGGVPWMLQDGETGLVLPRPQPPEGDPQILADALCRVLQNPDEACRMGQRARDEAEQRFRPAAVAQRTYEVYRQVVEESR
jgi:glycosyltransferase involved in cell wall biosynthesis